MLKVGALVCFLVSLHGLTECTILLRCNTKDIGQRLPHPRSCTLFWTCTADKSIVVRQCPKGLHFNERLQVCDLISRAGCTKEPINPLLAQCQTCDCSVCCAGCSVQNKTPAPANLTPEPEAISIDSKISTIPSEDATVAEDATVVEDGTATEDATVAEEATVKEDATVEKEKDDPEDPAASEVERVPKNALVPEDTIVSDDATVTEERNVAEESTENETVSEGSNVSEEAAPSEDATASEETNVPEETAVSAEGKEEENEEPLIATTLTDTDSLTHSKVSDIPVTYEDCDSVCCGQPNSITLPMPGSCRTYVICQNQRQTVMTCPNNLHFNEANGNCDFPENANCKSSQNDFIVPATGPSGTQCAYGGRCIGQPDGTLFEDENKNPSANFVVCQCECEVSRSCSAPLMYNSKIASCDWPDNFSSCD